MRLSLSTDYSLRVLMYLSGLSERSTVEEMANFYQISKDHVAKVVQRLARLGYVRSVRGLGGGVELAKQPDRINIGDVILAVQGEMHLLECVAAEEAICVIQPGCRLRDILAEAERIQIDYLKQFSLQDVVTPGKDLIHLTFADKGE